MEAAEDEGNEWNPEEPRVHTQQGGAIRARHLALSALLHNRAAPDTDADTWALVRLVGMKMPVASETSNIHVGKLEPGVS